MRCVLLDEIEQSLLLTHQVDGQAFKFLDPVKEGENYMGPRGVLVVVPVHLLKRRAGFTRIVLMPPDIEAAVEADLAGRLVAILAQRLTVLVDLQRRLAQS